MDGVMILIGMSALEQMKDNQNSFTHFEPLSQVEQDVIAAVCE